VVADAFAGLGLFNWKSLLAMRVSGREPSSSLQSFSHVS